MTIDFDKPVRARQLRMDETFAVEILRANLPEPRIAVGLIFVPRSDGKKGFEPWVMLFDANGITDAGYQLENFEPEVAGYVPRSLRVDEPGRQFRTKAGAPARFRGPNGVDLDWEISYLKHPGKIGYLTTDAAGRVVAPRASVAHADEMDIVEVNPPITRYVRVYDKPKTAKNPSCCTNWYEFNSLAEAQANMQGVRAIVPVTYTEGDNFPCLE